MAKLTCPQNMSPRERLLDGGEEGDSASQSPGDVTGIDKREDAEISPVTTAKKSDSALSRSSRLAIPELLPQPQTQQAESVESTQDNTEQKSSPTISQKEGSKTFSSIHETSSIFFKSGSDADDEDNLEPERCQTRRGSRESISSPCSINEVPWKKKRCDCPLMDLERVKKLRLRSASGESTGEVPVEIQEHFDNCIWRGDIGVALTTGPSEAESAEPPTLPENEERVSSPETPTPANEGSSQRGTDPDPDPDPEIASPELEKGKYSTQLQRYLRTLPWIFAWMVLFAVFCTIIGQYHTSDRTPSLSSEQQINSNISDQRAQQWRTFSHAQEYTYTLPWPTEAQLDNLTSKNATVRKSNANSLPAQIDSHIDDIWHQDLEAKTILGATNLTVELLVTANHTLDLTALCLPVPSQAPPKSSPKPHPPTLRISSHSNRESKAIALVKNLLTCLWFLPIWLLSQKLVEHSHTAWLTYEEARTRIRIAAVVMSFLAAAALELGTEVAVRCVAETIQRE
jgi:hypothetical protein